LRVVVSMSELPKIVVMASRSSAGLASMNSSAMASSMPGSVSKMILCVMGRL
jgi:hypothetical protein